MLTSSIQQPKLACSVATTEVMLLGPACTCITRACRGTPFTTTLPMCGQLILPQSLFPAHNPPKLWEAKIAMSLLAGILTNALLSWPHTYMCLDTKGLDTCVPEGITSMLTCICLLEADMKPSMPAAAHCILHHFCVHVCHIVSSLSNLQHTPFVTILACWIRPKQLLQSCQLQASSAP